MGKRQGAQGLHSVAYPPFLVSYLVWYRNRKLNRLKLGDLGGHVVGQDGAEMEMTESVEMEAPMEHHVGLSWFVSLKIPLTSYARCFM